MLVLTTGKNFHINNQRSVFSGVIDTLEDNVWSGVVRSWDIRINGIAIYEGWEVVQLNVKRIL